MSFQYTGGTIVYSTFTGTSRASIVENSVVHMTSAGWTEVVGTSTVGNRWYDSATTPAPQSLNCRVRIYDPGTGTCARAVFRSQDELQIGIDHYLEPLAGRIFTIVAYKHQICMFVAQSLAARTFVMGGVPFLETFLTTGASAITQAIWSQGNASSDTDTTAEESFRTRGHARGGRTWNTLNTTAWNTAGGGGAIGTQRLLVNIRGNNGDGTNLDEPTYWHNDYATKIPARICWGPTASSVAAEINGQLWGGAVICKDYPMETVATFDSHNWIAITNSNITDYGRPTLFLATN